MNAPLTADAILEAREAAMVDATAWYLNAIPTSGARGLGAAGGIAVVAPTAVDDSDPEFFMDAEWLDWADTILAPRGLRVASMVDSYDETDQAVLWVVTLAPIRVIVEGQAEAVAS